MQGLRAALKMPGPPVYSVACIVMVGNNSTSKSSLLEPRSAESRRKIQHPWTTDLASTQAFITMQCSWPLLRLFALVAATTRVYSQPVSSSALDVLPHCAVRAWILTPPCQIQTDVVLSSLNASRPPSLTRHVWLPTKRAYAPLCHCKKT